MWAGATGTPYGTCGPTPQTDTLDSGSYTASYDAVGDMLCRAPTSSTTCSGTQTGAQLGYDNEGRLTAWQNAPSSPTSQTSNLYDGEGRRVEQQVTSGATTTSTIYVGSLEEVSITGSTTTTTTYYYAGNTRLALAVNGPFSYLASDGLGNLNEVIAADGTGNVTFQQLYYPFGSIRYATGTAPTAKAFTGQRLDSADGLYYYGARYYDPTAHQCTSADTVANGLNRYAYVHDSPETLADPTGHRECFDDCGGGGGGGHPPSPKQPQDPMVRAIHQTFHDWRTRLLLTLLLRSPTGAQFVDFLLQAGEFFGGDRYIIWTNDPHQCGACTDGKSITLNTSIWSTLDNGSPRFTNPNSPNLENTSDLQGLIGLAGTLIHEATESYLALGAGMWFPASTHMDYVAQWFGGKVGQELGKNLNVTVPDPTAYGHMFNYWMRVEGSSAGYGNQWDNPVLRLGANVVGAGISDTAQYFWDNGMGLSADMLLGDCVAGTCAN